MCCCFVLYSMLDEFFQPEYLQHSLFFRFVSFRFIYLFIQIQVSGTSSLRIHSLLLLLLMLKTELDFKFHFTHAEFKKIVCAHYFYWRRRITTTTKQRKKKLVFVLFCTFFHRHHHRYIYFCFVHPFTIEKLKYNRNSIEWTNKWIEKFILNRFVIFFCFYLLPREKKLLQQPNDIHTQ